MDDVGLVLGDVFESTKGDFVVTGIQFNKGERIGCIIKPYITANDDHSRSYLLIDTDEKEITYKYNTLWKK